MRKSFVAFALVATVFSARGTLALAGPADQQKSDAEIAMEAAKAERAAAGTRSRIGNESPSETARRLALESAGDAGGGDPRLHHDDISGSSWQFMGEIDQRKPPRDLFSGVNFFYRDTVLNQFKPESKAQFHVVGVVEVGCRGRWDALDGDHKFQMLTNNEGDGSKRIYAYHHCHVHSCKKNRQVCFGVFVTVTAGKEIVDADGTLMAPLPPDYSIECHGSTYWKSRSDCKVQSHNGDGFGGPSVESQMLGTTTINKRTPATLAPDKNAKEVYEAADFLGEE